MMLIPLLYVTIIIIQLLYVGTLWRTTPYQRPVYEQIGYSEVIERTSNTAEHVCTSSACAKFFVRQWRSLVTLCSQYRYS
jgi:hypothetical protein